MSFALRSGLLLSVALISGCHYAGDLSTEPQVPVYTVRQLGLLPSGLESQATAGSSVAIVGWGSAGDGGHHAVMFAGGVASRLAEPAGAGSSEARGVSSQGVIVGFATLAGSVRRAVAWGSSAATPVTLPGLGGANSAAFAINDQNTIAGIAQTDSGDTALVLWQFDGSTYQVARLDPSGGVADGAAGINSHGEVAGNFGDGTGAFFWDSTDGFDTLTPANGTATARGLSNFGIEVGTVSSATTPTEAYVYTGQIGVVLMGGPPPGYIGVAANAVNDQGVIAGNASTTNSAGVVLTSVAVIGTVVSPQAAFTVLPSLGGPLASPSDNATTPCGGFLGWATVAGSSAHRAVAWVPTGCPTP